MDAVGADHEVETLQGAVAQFHVDTPVRVRGARCTLVPKRIRRQARERIVEHVLEIAAHEVEVAIAKEELAQRRIRQREPLASISAEECKARDRIVDASDRRQEAEALRSIVSRSEEVDHVAFVA